MQIPLLRDTLSLCASYDGMGDPYTYSVFHHRLTVQAVVYTVRRLHIHLAGDVPV